MCFEGFFSALVALKFSWASFLPLLVPWMYQYKIWQAIIFQWLLLSYFFSSHPWLFNDSHGHRGLFVVPEVSTKIIFLFEINYEECIAWNPNPWNSKKCFFLFSSQSWLWNDSGDWTNFFYSSMRLHQNTSWKSTMKDVSFLKPIHWIWIWFQKKRLCWSKGFAGHHVCFSDFSKTYMVVFCSALNALNVL